MELKVRVDGLSRVVCGVSEKTTCQEVVIALAHAMGRTGRFTLIEKWRDSERPLLPTDYPVKVLHKWGEYASEVQLLLHQSDKKVTAQSENIPKQVNAQDKLLPISKSHVKEKEGGLRRVLTFSGSHNTVTPLIRQGGSARGRHRMTDQKPFDKIPEADSQIVNARTRRDPSPHVNGMGEGFHPAYRADRDRTTYRGYRDEMLEPTQHAFHIHSKEAKHVKLNQDDDHRAAPSSLHNNTGGRTTHFDRPYLSYGNFSQAGNTAQPTDFPTDHNHRLRGSNNVANISVVSNTNRHPPPHPATANRFTPKLEQRADVHSNQNDVFDPHLRKSPYNYKVPNAQTYVNESVRSHSPLVQNRNRNSAFQPVRSITPKEQNEIPFMNGDLDVPLYSGVPEPPTDLEEYDLDTNLPGVGHTSAKQLLIEEYRMPGDGRHREQDLSPTDNAAVEDPEVVRMRKLVALQQDRIKAQGNQITGIEQDIKQLEQEDREQTELLTKISDEIIDLTKANHKYEIEIKELDATKWVDVIESEKNQEKEARVSIEDIKTRLVRTTEEIQGLNSKAVELEKEISVEKSELEKDAEILKEKEREIEKEIQSVTEDLEKENQKIDDDKVALDDIERELKELSARMDQQKEEVEELEKELKDANIEEFNLSPKEARKAKKPDTGEAVLKMLEGRVSPAIGLTRKSVVSPLSKVLSASKNPNGVWV